MISGQGASELRWRLAGVDLRDGGRKEGLGGKLGKRREECGLEEGWKSVSAGEGERGSSSVEL